MNNQNFGFNDFFKKQVHEENINIDHVARVIIEHKERYIIANEHNEFEAEITGNLRFSANKREDFPAVGDWVGFIPFEENSAVINRILKRQTVLERKIVKGDSEKQIIAANIDTAFIVQSVDRDFNINRMERYLSLIHSGYIAPIVILNKTDLITTDELNSKISEIQKRHEDIKIIAASNINFTGVNDLKNLLAKGKTYCFIGSSGVGKSSLINSLLKNNMLKTKDISISTNKGRHATTQRQLIVLENGSILIDTPGMREVGLTDSSEGIEKVFNDILELAGECRYGDCTHTSEQGCAVIAAVNSNIIDQKALDNYHKLNREAKRFESSVAEKRKVDKEFGKMIKRVMKTKKDNDL